MAFTGGCLCGRIRYEIQKRHLKAIHCYCTMCRKAHGTACSTHALVQPEKLTWTTGANDRVKYRSSQTGFREFCPSCGTHVVVHGQVADDDTLAVPVGTLDGDPAIEILGHMFVAERPSWHTIADRLPQYETWPPGVQPASAP